MTDVTLNEEQESYLRAVREMMLQRGIEVPSPSAVLERALVYGAEAAYGMLTAELGTEARADSRLKEANAYPFYRPDPQP